jgi:hypothetical protein
MGLLSRDWFYLRKKPRFGKKRVWLFVIVVMIAVALLIAGNRKIAGQIFGERDICFEAKEEERIP